MTEEKTGFVLCKRRGYYWSSFWILLIHLSAAASFTALERPTWNAAGRHASTTSTVCYLAMKQQQKKKNKAVVAKGPSPAAGGGGGFGAASPKTTKKYLEGKVRTVSGHTGSGSKPLRLAANTFDALRNEYGREESSWKECCNDVYCKSPLNDPQLLWYVGKIAVRPNTAATHQQAVIAQKRLILEYAKRELRPQNFGGKYASSLELWLAPGDSELDAVQNKIPLEKVVGSAVDLAEDFAISDVGFNPELYIGDEREKGGLRIKRDDEGKPVKPVFEMNQSM